MASDGVVRPEDRKPRLFENGFAQAQIGFVVLDAQDRHSDTPGM